MDGRFYDKGLSFGCRKCSACCRGEPGYVFLQQGDLERLAKRKGMAPGDFLDEYCRIVDLGTEKAYSLRERKNHDCALWEDGCSVYEDRPIQCSTYPFWARILESEASWKEEARSCPGIGQGRLFTKEEIEEKLLARRARGLLGPGDPVSGR